MKLQINKTSIHSEIIDLLKEQMELAIANIEEDITSCTDISDAEMTLEKTEGKLVIVTRMFAENGDTAVKCQFEMDDFLDTVKNCYSYGEDGWGEEMISDLEILKGKIQDRIDQMKKEIELEE
jgi:hypothetical protein